MNCDREGPQTVMLLVQACCKLMRLGFLLAVFLLLMALVKQGQVLCYMCICFIRGQGQFYKQIEEDGKCSLAAAFFVCLTQACKQIVERCLKREWR